MIKQNKIWLSSPHMSGKEKLFVNEVFKSNWIAPLGPCVDLFEKLLSDYLSVDARLHTAVLSSGTAAMHIALDLLNVKKDDIILVQSFTFCGSVNPVLYNGAKVIFIDSEIDTWNMCPLSLETALKKYRNKKVKAVVPVHLYGMPAKIEEIKAICARFNVPIIEDAAESLGSMYKEKYCGTFGDFSILSFNGNKIITTSGGGALVSKNSNQIQKAKFLATQARDEAPYYLHSELGYNYRMSNVLAGIGCGQIEVLNKRVLSRRKNNSRYREFFQDIPGVSFQSEPTENYYSNFWLTAINIDSKKTFGKISCEDVRLALLNANIEARPLWKPMHTQPLYKGSTFIGSGVCEKIFQSGLCLPSGSNLSKSDFERIFKVLGKVFKKA